MKKNNNEVTIYKGIIMKVQNKLAEVLLEDQTSVQCILPKTILTDRNCIVAGDKVDMTKVNEN